MRAELLAKQQEEQRKQRQKLYLIGLCYIVALAVIVGVLIKFRKSIAVALRKGEGKMPIKRMLVVLSVLVLLMLLDPLTSLTSGEESLGQVLSQSLSIIALLLVGAAVVWGIRKVRTKWPFVTIMLYGIFLVLLVLPTLWGVLTWFGKPEHDFQLTDMPGIYHWLYVAGSAEPWPLWLIFAGMIFSQMCLLVIPVRIRHERPKHRRGIWLTAIGAGFLFSLLILGLLFALLSAIMGDEWLDFLDWRFWAVLGGNWLVWMVIFLIFSRNMDSQSYVRRLMRWLIGGSILELLIAVPSHIIVRHRDVCCAHGFTAAGLTTGLAVIFFAFGPGLYFLYADRIRGKRPDMPEQSEEPTPEIQQ